MRTLFILSLTLLSLLSFPSWGSDQLECIGEVDRMVNQTHVIFEKEQKKLTVRYPKGTNLKSKVDEVWSSDKFTTLGSFADMGVGIWFINKKTMKFSYIQSKDLSWVDAGDFSFNQYVGRCSLLSGNIANF